MREKRMIDAVRVCFALCVVIYVFFESFCFIQTHTHVREYFDEMRLLILRERERDRSCVCGWENWFEGVSIVCTHEHSHTQTHSFLHFRNSGAGKKERKRERES